MGGGGEYFYSVKSIPIEGANDLTTAWDDKRASDAKSGGSIGAGGRCNNQPSTGAAKGIEIR